MFPLVAQKSVTPHGGEVGVFGMFQSLSSPSVDKLTHSLQPVSWVQLFLPLFIGLWWGRPQIWSQYH